MDCLFCKILKKEIPAEIVFENDSVFAIKDINPQAPIHNLIIPKTHISTINDITSEDLTLLGEMVLVAKNLAKKHTVDQDGYRLVWNVNSGAGQTVFHIHLHLLGGRGFSWPPG